MECITPFCTAHPSRCLALSRFRPSFVDFQSRFLLHHFAKSISPSQGTRRCFRRKSPRRLRNRCSVLQCWRLRLIDITYINYLPAIRACKLHTGCQSVSNMNMPAIPNLPCRRSLILRPRFATAFLLNMPPCVHTMDTFQILMSLGLLSRVVSSASSVSALMQMEMHQGVIGS